MKNTYRIPLLLEPQPEGGFTVLCPAIPELVTEADTLEEVQAHVADALAALLELYADTGEPVPDALRALVAETDLPIQTELLVAA
jgi:antitoxin HicB